MGVGCGAGWGSGKIPATGWFERLWFSLVYTINQRHWDLVSFLLNSRDLNLKAVLTSISLIKLNWCLALTKKWMNYHTTKYSFFFHCYLH